MNDTTAIAQRNADELVKRAQRRDELAAVSFQPNGQMFQPKDGRELMDMANLMSTAGLMVKDIYRGNPGACMGLIAVCAPYGMNPLQVSWKTYQTKPDAPIAYEAQVIVAMVNASNAIQGSLRYRFEGEGQNRRCICYGTLKGDSEPVEVWSPPLGQITPKNSPLWKSDPDQQMCYYTGRSWARRYKPEMLLGIYDVDETAPAAIGPDHARDVTPKVAAPKPGRTRYVDPDPVVEEIQDAENLDPAQAEAGKPRSISDVIQAVDAAIRRELTNGAPHDATLDFYADELARIKAEAPDEHADMIADYRRIAAERDGTDA